MVMIWMDQKNIMLSTKQTPTRASFIHCLSICQRCVSVFFLSFFFDCYSILINGKICHLIVAIQCVHISENENKVNTLFLFFRAQLVGSYRPSARAVWCIRSNWLGRSTSVETSIFGLWHVDVRAIVCIAVYHFHGVCYCNSYYDVHRIRHNWRLVADSFSLIYSHCITHH